MSIIKNINSEKPFEVLPRELLQQCDKKRSNKENTALSLQAIGLLCNLQSYPENWEIHKTELYNRYEKNGRRQIQNAWNELVDAKYIVQFKVYDGNKLDYYYYFSIYPITDEQIKQLEEFHNSKSLNRFELKEKKSTVQNVQQDNDGLSPTVQSEQYNLYSKEVNSTKRTDNIIDNQHNTHEDNTHEDNTHYNTSDSSSQDEIINKIKTEFGIKITPAYKNEILKLIQHFNNDIINYAIEYASTYGSSPKQFLLKVLNNWKDANIKTLEQAQNYTVRSNKNNIVNFSREKTPKWLHEREDENTNEEMTEEEKAKFEKEREAFRKELEENWGES